MSTKTLRKRIALVAVSALSAGLLTVVAAPQASATSDAGKIDSVTANGTGANTASYGLLTSSFGVGQTTNTATLLQNGWITLAMGGGGYAVASAGGTAIYGATSVDADQTAATGTAVSVKATGAVGSTFTISTYSSSASTTLVDKFTVTIAGSSLTGTASIAESDIYWDSNTTGVPTNDSTNGSTTWGGKLYLAVNLQDAYGVDIDSTSGSLVVTSTEGAYVRIVAENATSAGSVTTAVSNSAPSPLWVTVVEKTAGAGWNGTVTVSYNGVVLATKAGSITGKPSTISVTPLFVGKAGTTADNAGSFSFQVKDSSGNLLGLDNATDLAFDTSSNTAIVTSAVGTTAPASGNAYVGKGGIACVASAEGTSNVVVKTTLSDGTIVKSAPFVATCGGSVYSYTASLDKASYKLGDIATLKVTFKTLKGNKVEGVTTIGNANTDNTISSPMMSRIGGDTITSASSTTDVDSVITHKFTVGTTGTFTPGAYNMIVTYGDVTTSDPVTVAYTITSDGAGVSNTEVLAAIVKLIASINKQIVALQKLLTKKK